MQKRTERNLKTGGDPRTLPDFIALREELSKLQHPARPDVDWVLVEKLCLSLFRQNGVELQTAAWYTLARTKIAGLTGLNEGMAIIEALASWQWAVFWPLQAHARAEIITGLSQRLQTELRTIVMTSADLKRLYESERILSRLIEVLCKVELTKLSQLQTLQSWIHSTVVRLENSNDVAEPDVATTTAPTSPNTVTYGSTITHGVTLEAKPNLNPKQKPKQALEQEQKQEQEQNNPFRQEPLIYVAYHESKPNVVIPPPQPPVNVNRFDWKSFVVGLACMAVVAIAVSAVKGLFFNHDRIPAVQASVSPIPVALSGDALAQLQHDATFIGNGPEFIEQTKTQLTELTKLKPDWSFNYGTALVKQTQALWPSNSESQSLETLWLTALKSQALPQEKLEGWHRAKRELDQLAERLNSLDGQKGRYITASELKTVVFNVSQALNQSVPLEEQLRQLALSDQPTEQSQIDLHLQQLMARYALMKLGERE